MISWIGGKSTISKWIIPYIPKDIKYYCEPFSGAFWVYLKMDLKKYPDLEKIVYNDYNDYLVNFFMCCKDYKNFHPFVSKYESQNKDLFYKFQKDLYKDKVPYQMPNLENAVKFAYLCTQVWSGLNSETNKFIDLKGKYRSKFDTFKDKLLNEKFTNNLDKITNFENLDFQNVIEKYDHQDAFFYVDAPYYSTEHYYSNNIFSKKDHERLANCLKSIKGKFAMSYYYFDDLEKWFPKDIYNWKEKEFAKAAAAKAGKTQTKGTEILIMNY
jgi:DNA adenine methylase